MSLRKALLAATVLSLPIAAQAQPISGLYVGAGAGLNYRQDSTYASRNSNNTTSFEYGYAAVGSVGWGFGNGIRAEVEGNYRYNDNDRTTGTGFTTRTNSGNVRSYGVMGNAFYDFDLTGFGISPRTFSPYLGFGLGYIWNDWRNIGASLSNATTSTRLTINDRAGRFGYQGIVGGAFALDSVAPGLALTLEYRYLGSLGPELTSTSRTTVGGVTTVANSNLRPTNGNHSALLGFRYAFNAPRPAPVTAVVPPAPVQTVARTYLVFFDWNRADLTDRARQIIAEAAAARTTVRSTRIEVSGHADRSGPDAYNQALSMRRAEAVAAELVRRGVPRSELVIQAFGESRPLVPTADGVREPQNRRVEIVLR